MKIPFLNIYITTVDWKTRSQESRKDVGRVFRMYKDSIEELSKYKTPRGKDGRFKSKKDKMTKQLKAEVADLRKAGL